MSERYNVNASTVLGENYKITNIECSDYNPNIDNSITVTITVTDVYGDAISGESVTVTASEGNFTQLNGSNITNASSVTGTTNSSGQFTLTYSCSEWGLITFSANNSTQQIIIDQSPIIVQRENYHYSNLNLANGSSIQKTETITIPSGYKVLDYYIRAWSGVTQVSILSLSGTTLTLKGWNNTGATQSEVYLYVGILYVKDQ